MARRGDGIYLRGRIGRFRADRLSVGLAALLLAGALVAPSGSVYDAHGRRQGYVKESRPGQYDLYDQHSRRLGYGRQGRDGTIQLYDKNSWRLLEIRPDRMGPRR